MTDPNGTAGTPVTMPAGGVGLRHRQPVWRDPGGRGLRLWRAGDGVRAGGHGDALALYKAAPAGTPAGRGGLPLLRHQPEHSADGDGLRRLRGQLHASWIPRADGGGQRHGHQLVRELLPGRQRGARVTDTAGAANGSCKVAVINEVLIDASGGDDGKGFVEIAGPGGSVIGGAKITDVEGKGASAGHAQRVGRWRSLPVGIRIPADGILLVADDGTVASSNTAVPNFVAGVDVTIDSWTWRTAVETPSSSIAAGTALLDTVGYDVTGANLDTNTAIQRPGHVRDARRRSPWAPGRHRGSVADALARQHGHRQQPQRLPLAIRPRRRACPMTR